ncbi:GHKL domain protein [Halobacteriovorax sp. BALOs_7]|uniref:histidine kinase n=1 Tax=Halobacteriovorax vibrionivorans TaxID=2152716 RepID=A0ABY0IHI0_9BACT|nr:MULTISPECIES: HAMP domain-containing sensor histidine kinase [Halobacteriovorax]AYF45316.1 GHKL domain protein [Halobacteriovorax sp. BALOs_7]RZF22401.1 sensor histidine kinase [Halobacteriovorax vibrionivorans]TGD47592.1 sensor histidine kinase [Halobacteriovorax sp. Y22]
MKPTIKRSSYLIPMIVGVVLCLCFSGLAFIVFDRYIKQNDIDFKEHRKSISKQIVESLKVPVWNLNSQYIGNISQAFIYDDEESVVSIKIEDEEGNLLSEVNREHPVGNGVLPHQIMTEEFDIIYRDRLIGKAIIDFSNISIVRDSGKIFSFLGLWFSLTLFFTLLIVAIVCYYLLIKPLNYFVSTLKRNANGEYGIVKEDFYLSELSILAKTLNYATKEIKFRDEKLQQYNDELGERIAEKSRELYIQKERSLVSERLASLGQMAAGIAHEINNPLFIISGNIARLKRQLGDDSSKANDFLSKIDNATTRISEIVTSMKTLSRSDSLNEKEFVEVKELESIVGTICNSRLTEKNIEMSFHYEDGHRVYANKTQLYQVLVNLINNSIDAVENLDERFIHVKFFNTESKQIVEVVDSGDGIPQEIVHRIMDPFFTTKDVNKGTGLGLSLSHEMMVKNGGELIYDDSSKKTTFTLTLPLSTGVN